MNSWWLRYFLYTSVTFEKRLGGMVAKGQEDKRVKIMHYVDDAYQYRVHWLHLCSVIIMQLSYAIVDFYLYYDREKEMQYDPSENKSV